MIRIVCNRYNGEHSLSASCSDIDIAKQGLDTSVFALLSAVDECGKVNNLSYSEDEVINAYHDNIVDDITRVTSYESTYYEALGVNASENASSATATSETSSDSTASLSSSVNQNSTENLT